MHVFENFDFVTFVYHKEIQDHQNLLCWTPTFEIKDLWTIIGISYQDQHPIYFCIWLLSIEKILIDLERCL